ncbi:hypothetical protein Srubr_60850 [Streptomyces rubradiris]|uniref:Uncharacterized protein n=1 Tax=Streptomyces rubradiris TaxID=285531 RepID=A0ABQ3RK60_STRRR|nr:hypothetical protein GCM10018792_61460 [Streptomyces rubradiris]GHI56239.1 hypothetical protein Srubr_60850 [Streptomyces rubradiris]
MQMYTRFDSSTAGTTAGGQPEPCMVVVFVFDQELSSREVRLMTALKATVRSARVCLTSRAVA